MLSKVQPEQQLITEKNNVMNVKEMDVNHAIKKDIFLKHEI